MTHPIRSRHDAELLAVADRLFHEYDEAPVITVVRAITSARNELREAGVVLAPPDLVGARARGFLRTWTVNQIER